MPPGVHLTTPIIWMCTAILAVSDTLLGLLAIRLTRREQFRKLRPRLTLAGGLFFVLVWAGAMLWAWDWFYAYIFPASGRYFLPLIFFFLYKLIAWIMGWLSLRLPVNPALTWCVLGGVEGLLSHLYAIYALGAASRPPIMHGTDPFAVLVFAIFEKAFYWSILLIACRLLSRNLFTKEDHSPFQPIIS